MPFKRIQMYNLENSYEKKLWLIEDCGKQKIFSKKRIKSKKIKHIDKENKKSQNIRLNVEKILLKSKREKIVK